MVDFPGGSDGKQSTCNVGDLGLIPGLGNSPEGGMTTYSSILAWRTPIDIGARWLQSMGHKEMDMTERLSTSLDGYTTFCLHIPH